MDAITAELLKACKLAAKWLHDNSDRTEPLRTIEQAIAKAEGRSVTQEFDEDCMP